MVISGRRLWRNWGNMHLFAAYCYKLRMMKQLFCLVLRKEKQKKILYYFRALSIFKNMIYSIPGGKKPIYFYCGPCLEVEKVTKPGKSYVVFVQSLCATSVLGSQVFGQALMESSGIHSTTYIRNFLLSLIQCRPLEM